MTEGLDRRKKAYKDLVLNMPKPDGTITEELDGQMFKYTPEPRCRVCSADDPRKDLNNGKAVKDLVERLLLYPMPVAGILRYIEPLMEEWPAKARITAKSIRGHLDRHLAWDKAAMRYMVERWANQKGMSVLDSAGRMILTEEAWLEASAAIGWEQMMAGNVVPTWSETQKAFERIQSLKEMAEGTYSTTYLISQLNRIIQVVRESVPAELWPQILERLEKENSAPPPDAQLSELPEGHFDDEDLEEQVIEAVIEVTAKTAPDEDDSNLDNYEYDGEEA